MRKSLTAVIYKRLHRGSKRADRVAVYTHRDVIQLVTQLSSRPIHRAEHIPVYAFDRRFVDAFAAHVERRTTFALTVTENQLYIEIAGQSLQSTRITHRIAEG
ncbi:MAG: YaeQ family protein [Oscillochloridaceae bacterium umkhey_bin13]